MQATFKVYIKMYWNQSGKLEVFDTAASMGELMDNDEIDGENDSDEDEDESDEENEEPTPSKDKNNNIKKVEEGKNRRKKLK